MLKILENLYTRLQTTPLKKTVMIAGFLLILIALPLAVVISQQQQNIKQEASTIPNITLFAPETGCQAPPGKTAKTQSFVVFKWSAPSGVAFTHYDVVYNDSHHFTNNTNLTNNPKTTSLKIPTTSCTTDGPGGCSFSYNIPLNWYVRAIGANGSEVAKSLPPRIDYTADCSANNPGSSLSQPTGLSQNSHYGRNGGADNTIFTDFSWSAVSGATSYLITWSYNGITYGPYGTTGTSFFGPQPAGTTNNANGNITTFAQCSAQEQAGSGYACGFSCNANVTWRVTAMGGGKTSPSASQSFTTVACKTTTTTPTDTPPSCTLAASPNRVSVNQNSNLVATCSGNPNQFTWTETCGDTAKVNSASTTWKAPSSSGNCTVSVNACNSFGCSKPSTTIQVTSPTPTPTPTNAPTPTPTPIVGGSTFSLVLGLDGIGNTGDTQNPNPIANSDPSFRSNPNPNHKTRIVTIEVENQAENKVGTGDGSITYDSTSGKFKGNVNVSGGLSGNYRVFIKSPGYLRKRLSAGIQISPNSSHNLSGDLVAGDINSTNSLNLLDFNILISCSIFSRSSGACTSGSSFRTYSDLTDNGIIDHNDYNLLLREWTNFTDGD